MQIPHIGNGSHIKWYEPHWFYPI